MDRCGRHGGAVEELLKLLGGALRLDKDDGAAGATSELLEQHAPLVILLGPNDRLSDERRGRAHTANCDEDVFRHELGGEPLNLFRECG